jgi:cyanophycin synthetase
VVTDLGDEDTGSYRFHDPSGDGLATVLNTVVKVVALDGAVVLNASDHRIASMAAASPAPVVLFAPEGTTAALAQHRERGGRVVTLRDGQIVVVAGRREEVVAALECVPRIDPADSGFRVESILAATAAAWALKLSLAQIRTALLSFERTHTAV